jgi:hypothetical protein
MVSPLTVAAFTLSRTQNASALPCHEVTHRYYSGPDYAEAQKVR